MRDEEERFVIQCVLKSAFSEAIGSKGKSKPR